MVKINFYVYTLDVKPPYTNSCVTFSNFELPYENSDSATIYK